MTAGLGQAPTVGRLPVPAGWSVAAPQIRLAAVTLLAASLGVAPEVMAASPRALISEMTLANMASRAISGGTPRGCQERTGSISRSRPVSTSTSTSGHGTAIAADIREFAAALVTLGDVRDSGLLTDEEFTDRLRGLTTKSSQKSRRTRLAWTYAAIVLTNVIQHGVGHMSLRRATLIAATTVTALSGLTAPDARTDPQTQDQQFLEPVHSNGVVADNETLKKYAHQFCDAEGMQPLPARRDLYDQGVLPVQLYTVRMAASRVYCPNKIATPPGTAFQ